MLDVLRKWNIGIKVILGLVVLSFIIFYAGNFTRLDKNDPSRYVARVGKDNIDFPQFKNAFDMIKRQQQQFYGNQEESNPQMDMFIRQQAVQSLVDRKLMLREAKKAGIKATEQEVQDAILKYPFFMRNGSFVGMDEYQRIVDAAFKMDVEEFEKTMGEDVILGKFNDYLTAGMLVSDKELEDQYRKKSLTAKIDYVLFETKPAAGQIEAKPEDVRAYYESHKQDFQTGELRKVEYLWVSHQSEKNKVQISPEKLREHYDKNISRYSRPEQVHARHILLKVEQGKNNEEDVKKKAEELMKKLRSGADFAALAKEFSEDPGSKENGGDLGFFGRGRMVPEFEQQAFSQPVNQISDPVKTQFGYHIIETLGKQPAYTMDFALVKDQIYRELASPQEIKNAEEQAKKIFEEITKNKKSMAEISKIQLVELKNTDYFGHHEDLPGLSPAFRDTAFDLKKGMISEPVQVFQDFAIVRLVDTKPSEIPPFEKVQAKATQDYKQWKAEEQNKAEAQKFYDAAAAAADFKGTAEKLKLTIKSTETFTKGGYVADLGNVPVISEKAFEMKVNDISQPVKVNQNFAVYQLKEKKEFDPATFNKEKEELRQQLASQKYSTFLQGYRSLLRHKYEKEIWINEQAINPKET